MGKKNYAIYTPKDESRKMANLAKQYIGSKKTSNVADLSCGSGNLLAALAEVFDEEYHFYGYDIDANAIEETKYRLQGKKAHCICQDSLYLDLKLRFDLIIGNPPYLGEKNHKVLFESLRETAFGKKYYEAKMDYLYFFIEKACDMLEEGGILVYLTTNYWLRADGAKKLRACLREEGDFLYFEDYNASLFKGALGQHNILFVWQKGKRGEKVHIQEKSSSFFLTQEQLYDESGKIFLWQEGTRKSIEAMKKKATCRLGDLLEIKQGIVSGCDEAFIFSEYIEELREDLKPFYKNKDIFSYQVLKQEEQWILYLGSNSIWKDIFEKYLSPYRDRLEQRREVRQGKLSWWKLQWPREEKIFSSPKIVGRQRCKGNWFAYTEEEMYGSADIYYFLPKNSELDLFYILAFLNSSSFSFWYQHCGKRKGELYEFYTTPLQEVPIYYPNKKEREKISFLAQEQNSNYSPLRQKEIDNFFKKFK